MTSSFDRLSKIEQVILIAVLTALPTFLFPVSANAQVANKTSQVFEIKKFQTITIPENAIPTVVDLSNLINPEPAPAPENQTTIIPETAPVEAAPIKVEQKVVAAKANKSVYPPKVTGANRVYMHEPEIRAYICPKMGQKNCDIFVAVLKAENGTHECTRDNRGLNRNGSIDIGLAQINWKPGNKWHTFEQLQDCKYNLDVALEMYERRGFQPWYAYTKGAYKKFLKPANKIAPATEVAAAAIQ